MPRALRIEYPGAIYHVLNRGDRRESIFRDEADRNSVWCKFSGRTPYVSLGSKMNLISLDRDPTPVVTASQGRWLYATTLALLSLVAQCHGQGTMQPVHITYEGPPGQPPGTAALTQRYDEGGMSFTPIPGSLSGFVRVGINPIGGRPDDGTAYVQAGLGSTLMFSFTNGTYFELVSVDLAEYSMAYAQPITVHFVGYRSDGSVVTTDLITDGIIDGNGPIADFQTFNFGPEFSDLSRVETPTWAWSLDNLVVARWVPEPTTVVLLILGAALFSLQFLRRK